jgi:predicted ATPase/class 3 adenylate cyclase
MDAAQLPNGTITFLFTDIEGSTQLWAKYPQAMPAALQRHHTLLRQSIESCNGYVFQIVGDAFCAAFSSASDGLQAAICGQQSLNGEAWGEAGPIKARMAVHTGMAEVRAGEYTSGEYLSGLTLSRVSRLLSAGHGGQVLVSRPTRDLLAYDMPEGAYFRDLGEHRLKGLSQAEQIYQLIYPGLPSEFPPLTSLDTRPNNLPLDLTSFIGRQPEIENIKQQLVSNRLVTLTGSGGVGKTRLSIQVGHEMLPLFPQGVWLIELAPLADPEMVPQALVTLFGLPDDARRPAQMVLADYLREKTALLILDNCEHVIDACAQLVRHLLLQCPDIRVLASSREALGIEGEAALRVPSLSLPPAGNPTLETMRQSEAVRLFLDRAAVAMPGFALTETNTGAVARVCRRLDGIALAIELAASRVKLLRVEQIAERLDDAFRLLTGGSRTALPRQQTLRATIDWSYNLLSQAERGLLRQLAVFAGGGTLEAIEAVCTGEGPKDCDVLDLLTHLVDKSLVIAERRQGEEPRYYLLETIRQYAREKLNDSGEGQAVRERHTRWYMELTVQAEPRIHGHGQIEWLDRMELEHDNLRAALEWSLYNNVEMGLQTASSLTWFWVLRGHALEGFQQMEKLLAASLLEPSPLHARALTWAGWLALFTRHEERGITLSEASLRMSQEVGDMEGLAFSYLNLAVVPYQHGDHDRARPLAEEGLALFEKVGIQWGVRQALGIVGYINQAQGNHERALAIYQKSLVLSREIGDIDGAGWSLYLLGNLAFEQGHYEQALGFYEEGLVVERQVNSKSVIAWIIRNMGDVAIELGNYPQAIALLEENMGLLKELGDYRGLASTLNRLGRVMRLEGNLELAANSYSESCKLAREYGGRTTMAWDLAGLAELAALQDQPQKAAHLRGAAEAIPELTIDLWPNERRELEQMANPVRAGLDEADFAAGYAEGQAMTIEQVIGLALSD